MPKDFGRRLPMDSRMVDEIRRSPAMMREQGGSDWLSEWGGSSGYSYWARQPMEYRMTYFAVQEGYSTAQDIADVTGLRKSDVSKSLTRLENQGLVEPGVVSE